jgi:hypothetical protein
LGDPFEHFGMFSRKSTILYDASEPQSCSHATEDR